MQYFLLILGLALVVKSADILIDSTSKIAKKFGVSTFVIGITVVAFGTSAPELVVGIVSGVSNTNQLTLGNIIGSGISNVAWIVGLAALIMPLTVKKSVAKCEIPILLAIEAILALMLFANGLLSRINGIILMLLFAVFMIYIIIGAKKTIKLEQLSETEIADTKQVEPSINCESVESKESENCTEINDNQIENKNIKEPSKSDKKQSAKLWILAVCSLIGLFVGGRLTVDSSSNIAQSFGLSETLIGLTIISFATTLPELVASMMALRKKEHDIVLGNCIGSNIFNILLVLGASATISPIAVDSTLWIDMTVFFSLTVFIFIISIAKKSIRRFSGVLLLLTYFSYITYNILAVTVF